MKAEETLTPGPSPTPPAPTTRERGKKARASAAFVLALLLGGLAAGAQSNLETNSGIHFNFSPPGAPNLALGGAFIGLADDATAAYTNPAGLIKILHPEVTTELRRTHVFTDRGLLPSDANTACFEDRACWCQAQHRLDPGTSLGLEDGSARDTVPALSFLSYVYPRQRWALALYRHELVNFEARFRTFGPYLRLSRSRTPTGIPGDLDGRLASLDNRMRLDIVNYGVGGALRLGRGWSLGLALSASDFRLATRAERYVPAYRDAPDFASLPLVNVQTQEGDAVRLSGTLGLRWESSGGRLSLGAVYHRGPSFPFAARSRDVDPATALAYDLRQQGRFHVPDAYGLGLGLRLSDALRVAVDVDRVEYSALTRDLIDIFGLATLFAGRDPELDRFHVDDAVELHAGVEYFFLRSPVPVSLLAGAWYEPDHSLVFEGANEGFRAMFRPRDDQLHGSLGVGFSARRVQAYVAYDHSPRTRVLSLSAVMRFLDD